MGASTHTHTHSVCGSSTVVPIAEGVMCAPSSLLTQFMEECRGYERNKTAMVIGLMAPRFREVVVVVVML